MKKGTILLLALSLFWGANVRAQEVNTELQDSAVSKVQPTDLLPEVKPSLVPQPGTVTRSNIASSLDLKLSDPLSNGTSAGSAGAESAKPVSMKIGENALPDFSSSSTWLPKGVKVYGDDWQLPGLMSQRTATFAYEKEWGRLQLMPYTSVSKLGTGVYGIGGVNRMALGGQMKYHVNDWLTVGLYGQYVPVSTTDMRSMMMAPFTPKSNYGGFVEVMFNQHWGIGARVGREFAPSRNGKWEWKNTTDFYPIYKK